MTNVVLIVVDTWRKKDFVQESSLAPFLSKKTEEGVYLENFYSNSPWTVPSHASLFSGELPSEHGTTTEKTFFGAENRLTEYAKEKGMETYAVTENGLITRETGFADGFDWFMQTTEDLGGETWREIWEKDDSFEGSKQKYSFLLKKSLKRRDFDSIKSFFKHLKDKFVGEADYNGGKTERTLKEAEKRLGEDSFLFANIMAVHSPYSFNEEQRKKYLEGYTDDEVVESSRTEVLENYFPEGFEEEELEIRRKAYKASINYVDTQIKKFYEKAPEDTVFVVLGDHGELIGEYEKQGVKLIGHHLGTYKELVEVPCMIFGKGAEVDFKPNESDIFSIKDMRQILEHLLDSKEIEPGDVVNSEYFGRKGFVEQFGRKIPEGCEEIYNRKSFTLVNSEIKYDLTSDGEYAWKTEELTEKEQLDIGKASELKSKAEVLYGWRM